MADHNDVTRKVFTIAEAAQMLGISRSTLQAMRQAGEIGFITVGTGTRRPRVRLTQQHLDEYMLRAEQPATALPAARRG